MYPRVSSEAVQMILADIESQPFHNFTKNLLEDLTHRFRNTADKWRARYLKADPNATFDQAIAAYHAFVEKRESSGSLKRPKTDFNQPQPNKRLAKNDRTSLTKATNLPTVWVSVQQQQKVLKPEPEVVEEMEEEEIESTEESVPEYGEVEEVPENNSIHVEQEQEGVLEVQMPENIEVGQDGRELLGAISVLGRAAREYMRKHEKEDIAHQFSDLLGLVAMAGDSARWITRQQK